VSKASKQEAAMRNIMIAAVLLLVLTNAVVLTGVAYNRAGEPVARLELTERELSLGKTYSNLDENSGTALTINWRNLDSDEDLDNAYSRYNAPAWLNEMKLSELGFDIEGLKNARSDIQYDFDTAAVDVILVLEYQGDSYKQAIEIAERRLTSLSTKKDLLTKEELDEKIKWHTEKLYELKVSETRLYVIDAGLDQQALVKKYEGRNNTLFAHGEISVSLADKHLTGHIRELYIPEVHVPLPYSEQLSVLTKDRAYFEYGETIIPPRYQVSLNIGKRLEPWIDSVSKINK
jgi:hypothetical protein